MRTDDPSHHDHADDPARAPTRRRGLSRFHAHLIEMVLTMVLPLGAFLVFARGVLPVLGYALPIWVMLPSAFALMIAPMSAWMRHRRHAWRDVLEMNLAMIVGMLVALPVVRFGFPEVFTGLERIVPIMLVAMTLPMIALMYARRERYEHAAHVA